MTLACLKAKTEEKGGNRFLKLFFRSKTVSAIFGMKKKLLISNFLIGDCFLMYKEGFC